MTILRNANLLNLWHVPVLGDAVGIDALCDLRVQEVHFCAPASTADPRLCINDDVNLLNQSALQEAKQTAGRSSAFK